MGAVGSRPHTAADTTNASSHLIQQHSTRCDWPLKHALPACPQVLHEEGAILVNGWLRLLADAQTGVIIKKLRGALDSLLAARVAGGGGGRGGGRGGGGGGTGAARGAGRGSGVGSGGGADGRVVDAIKQLLVDAEMAATTRLS